MRKYLVVGLVVATAGCQVPVVSPRSASSSSSGKTLASENRTTYACGDPAGDQLMSGGEHVSAMAPCRDVANETAVVRGHEIEVEAQAPDPLRQLADAELIHCVGIPATELMQSPFAYNRTISEVVTLSTGPEVRGARIVFEPMVGLTVESMRKAIACHQARYESLGRPATYLPDDPTLVDGARIIVATRGEQVEVLVIAETESAGMVVVSRAVDLMRERTANR